MGQIVMDFIVWARPCVDFAWVVLIWLVQLIIYPSFKYTRDSDFVFWHNRYTGLISFFVAPLLFLQTGIYLWLAVFRSAWIDIASLVLVVLLWISTAFLSVPCHNALHRRGYCGKTIQLLVLTNWPRTFGWTMIFLIYVLDQYTA